MPKLPLTVILPVHNEEKNIRECLASVLFADQILVVDGASTDRTREIASEYPTTIIDTVNDFAEGQRLKGLVAAKHPWILFIDADERVTPELESSIASALHDSGQTAAYELRRTNLYRGRALHLNNPDWQLRLFLQNKCEFPNKIHRAPRVNGQIRRLNGDLQHHFFTTTQNYLKRLLAYTQEEASYPKADTGLLRRFAAVWLRPTWRFIQYYFLRRGFLDGYFGFFYSVSSAHYEWVVASRRLIDPPAPDGPATRTPLAAKSSDLR